MDIFTYLRRKIVLKWGKIVNYAVFLSFPAAFLLESIAQGADHLGGKQR